jgi:Uma2 family endonuclease
MAAHSGVRFLASDIWDAPDDDKRYEVINGELFVTRTPGWSHQRAIGMLLVAIGRYLDRERLGDLVSYVGVVLDQHTAIVPDLVYVGHERRGIVSERGVEGAPDLVGEVLSAETEARDRGIKMRAYAAAGVPHYWLLDPRTGALEPYRLGPHGYELVETYGPGSVFRPELFPGLEIAIADLWA